MRIVLCCILLLIGPPAFAAEAVNDSVIVVLGTRPLDGSTPSLDMRRRVERAVELTQAYPNSWVLFSGGKTAGAVSEAAMMARIASELGLASERIKLEEVSHTTEENALYSALIVAGLDAQRVFLITRPGHLRRASKAFARYSCFYPLVPVPSRISKEEMINDLRRYLIDHDSDFARQQIKKIESESR